MRREQAQLYLCWPITYATPCIKAISLALRHNLTLQSLRLVVELLQLPHLRYVRLGATTTLLH